MVWQGGTQDAPYPEKPLGGEGSPWRGSLPCGGRRNCLTTLEKAGSLSVDGWGPSEIRGTPQNDHPSKKEQQRRGWVGTQLHHLVHATGAPKHSTFWCLAFVIRLAAAARAAADALAVAAGGAAVAVAGAVAVACAVVRSDCVVDHWVQK